MSSKSKSASKYVDDLFNSARERTSDTINPFSYWVLKGKIAAGEYPGNQFSKKPSTFITSVVHSVIALFKSRFAARNSPDWKIGQLMDSGVDTFIDLTEPGERPPYNMYLHRQRRKRSRRSEYYRFPIPDKNVTTLEQMNEILEGETTITADRIDGTPGTHQITYSSKVDEIEIKHTANNRNGFAIGAIMAAEWIIDKKGIYSMKDVLAQEKR